MSFADAGNFGPVNATSSDSNEETFAIANRITFPDIAGRDAPGKTGSSAKPALVSEIGLFVSATGTKGRKGRLSIWASTGKSRVSTSSFAFQNTATPVLETRTISRTVFAGTQYWVGLSKESQEDTYYWSGTQGAGRIERSKAEPDFVKAGSVGFSGQLSWSLGYDVLPTEPLGLAGVVSGASEIDITLSWNVVSSDGGQAVSGYRIQRSLDGIVWSTIVANSNSTTRSFIDTNLVPGVRYYYQVAAINSVAIAHGTDYSGPYSASINVLIPGASAGNATSLLTATVTNPDPQALEFSDSGSGIPFTAIDVQYGSEFLFNEITAKTQDGGAVLQTTEAPLSKTLYGVRTYAITDLLNATDQGAFEVAKDYLTYYYQPQLRVQSITVDMSNLTIEQKLQVLALEIDDYISVAFTPNNIGDPKIASGLVTGISHRITITTHEVELRLRNERNLFTLNSDSKGILNVNILGP